MHCGKPLEDETAELCRDCRVKISYYGRGVGGFSYSEAMKKSMYAFKYNNRREYGDYYADIICRNYGNVISSWGCEVLVPVPLHSSKLRKRGYNQAGILAKALARLLNMPVDDRILIRTRNTRPQKELLDKERKTNLEKAFQTASNSIKYKKIILVDDIYTTGCTINECARTLKDAGAFEVYFITACIGNGF